MVIIIPEDFYATISKTERKTERKTESKTESKTERDLIP